MPRDIRLALRIRGDHYRWQITPEDAAQYEQHNRRKTIILWINSAKIYLFYITYIYVLYLVVLKTVPCDIVNRIKCCTKTQTKLVFSFCFGNYSKLLPACIYTSFLPNTILLIHKWSLVGE